MTHRQHHSEEPDIEFDTDRIDDAVLARLHLTRVHEKYGSFAWKGHDGYALGRLHEKGYIGNPVSKANSVVLIVSILSRFDRKETNQ